MGVISSILGLIGTLTDGTSSPMMGSTIPGFTLCLGGHYLLIERSDKNSSFVGSMLVYSDGVDKIAVMIQESL